MSTKSSATPRPLPPIPWCNTDAGLPEVTELDPVDGERQWKLANALADRGFAETLPGELT